MRALVLDGEPRLLPDYPELLALIPDAPLVLYSGGLRHATDVTFRYWAVPRVDAVEPPQGGLQGGDLVRLRGRGLEKSGVVTFDALHAVHKTFELTVVGCQADFLVCVKGNAEDLRRKAEQILRCKAAEIQRAWTVDKEPGRLERRRGEIGPLSVREGEVADFHPDRPLQLLLGRGDLVMQEIVIADRGQVGVRVSVRADLDALAGHRWSSLAYRFVMGCLDLAA